MNILVAIVLVLLVPVSAFGLQIFPGAEGYGTDTTGGRQTGSKLCIVDNLNITVTGTCADGGRPADVCHGTLEWCLENTASITGARIVVFSIGGKIDESSSITIATQYVTVFGQTAPGSGITLTYDNNGADGSWFKVHSSDVFIQGLRFRPDDYDYSTGSADCDGDNSIDVGFVSDHLTNVVLDRCSFSWACNEIVNWGWYHGNTNFTISNSIISEGFCRYLATEKYGKGLHAGDIVGTTIHHNLFAHNRTRNPKLGSHDASDVEQDSIDNIEFVNNVIYNYDDAPFQLQHSGGFVGDDRIQHVDAINNYFKKGSDTSATALEFSIDEDGGYVQSDAMIYLSGNMSTDNDCSTGVVPQWTNCVFGDDNQTTREVARTQVGSGIVVTQTAADAYNQVLTCAGAQSTIQPRDAIDQRVVSDVYNGLGRQKANAYGLWPASYSSESPVPLPIDTDKDGLPDLYEAHVFLTDYQKGDTDGDGLGDWKEDHDGDGYWNIEEYAYSLLGIYTGTPGGDPRPSIGGHGTSSTN